MLERLSSRKRLTFILKAFGLPFLDPPLETIVALCERLLSVRGEAAGTIIANEIFALYRSSTAADREQFLLILSSPRFGPDLDRLRTVATDYLAASAMPSPTPSPGALQRASEPRRQTLIRRLNLAEGGLRQLVQLRADLLGMAGDGHDLRDLDDALAHILGSWFNPGFLSLRRISWDTPASLLERLIRYEAVHAIRDLDALRERVGPEDRRCYALFHPNLPDDPLVFVQVALTTEIPQAIGPILALPRKVLPEKRATTAVFYSISSCQAGLRGIPFGNHLIKQVVQVMRRELPQLKVFATLSPMPGFARWLRGGETTIPAPGDPGLAELAASFLLSTRKRGEPIDPVARFHLHNGARVEQIRLNADPSDVGTASAFGAMVNYLYDPDELERNVLALSEHGEVAASKAVRALARNAARLMAAKAAA